MPEVMTIEELRELIRTLPDDVIIRVEFLKEDEDGREKAEAVQAP